MLSTLRSTVIVFAALTVVTGVLYPAAVTLIAQVVFPHQANGSIAYAPTTDARESRASTRDWWGRARQASDGARAIGSELIGQQFAGERYFWARPSATGPTPYNAAASTGSNLGPTNPAQLAAVRERVEMLRKAGGDEGSPVPVDLATASGSGLDPHISPAAAEYQVRRIARARGVGDDEVRHVIAENVEGRTLGVLGEPRVNVLRLNLALDELKSGTEQ